jgi:DNA-directed RNA polymerase subunit K/omega
VRSEEGRVEELSRAVGGRFKLTTLIQKQARQYYEGGRTFMPSVRNFDDLFNYILDEIEQGKIELVLPAEAEEGAPAALPAPAEEE